jgi:hypothetical protein
VYARIFSGLTWRQMNRRQLLQVVLMSVLPGAVRGAAQSRTYSDANFRLELPDGYLGPIEHAQGMSVSRGFRKPYAGTPLSTVILITVHDYGASFAKRVAGERAAVTRETLGDIVAGVERNRNGFRRGDPRPVTIAGYSGLKVEWNGSAQDIAFDGVIYCVLAGSRVYAVQIQDPTGRGAGRMAEAVRAVERMRINR